MNNKINTTDKIDILKGTDKSPAIIPEIIQEDELFYNMPTSPITDIILRAMNTNGNLSALTSKRKAINHSQKISILENNKKRRIKVDSKKYTVTLELSDIEKLIGSNKSAKKMFVFILIKINEQAYSDGQLKRNYIEFPLQELTDIGFYSRQQSARTGFKSSMDTLTSLKISGTLQQRGKKVIEQSSIEVIFTGGNIKNGVCTVYLNERISWGFIAIFYTILPRYCFRLSNRAFDLLCYIFYLARQNTKDIEEKGYFNIGLRAIQERLNLPSEKDAQNPGRNINNPERDIRQPIEKAIEEIEELNNNRDFTITPMYDLKASISHYLDDGYLKIELRGKYAENFVRLSINSTQKIQKAKKRKEAIIEKARIAKLANEKTNQYN